MSRAGAATERERTSRHADEEARDERPAPPPADGDGGPRLVHPLIGANPSTLVRTLARNGFVPPRRVPHVLLALGGSLARWPFTAVERLAVRRLRRRVEEMPPPVFIVGHWRSGTTHLYNVLSRSPRFGFVSPFATGMPWDFLGLVKVLHPFLARALPSHRFIDRVPVERDSPQEDETAMANMGTLSFYHGLYFPRRFRENFERGIFLEECSEEEVREWERNFTYFMEKLYLERGKRLLMKNPVYTARVDRLGSLYPGARFIHIYRNPYRVFESMRHFFPALFRELALQDATHVDAREVILETYPRMMGRLYRDASGLGEDRFVEVRFETFEERPLEEVERIYEALGLEGLDEARPRFVEYLESVADYRKNRYPFPGESLRLVEEHWGEWVDRWGYEPPV